MKCLKSNLKFCFQAHRGCLKSKQTKVWISDNFRSQDFGFQTFNVCIRTICNLHISTERAKQCFTLLIDTIYSETPKSRKRQNLDTICIRKVAWLHVGKLWNAITQPLPFAILGCLHHKIILIIKQSRLVQNLDFGCRVFRQCLKSGASGNRRLFEIGTSQVFWVLP